MSALDDLIAQDAGAKPSAPVAAAPQNLDAVFQAAGQQHGVDPNALKAIALQESSMNPNAVNPDSGASGIMGFTPANAKAYGINPLKPDEAIPTAAQMFRESLNRSGGDTSLAIADHFAGPNPALHGPKTAAYVQEVKAKINALNAQQPAPAAGNAPSSLDALNARDSGQQGGLGIGSSAAAAGPPHHQAPVFFENKNTN